MYVLLTDSALSVGIQSLLPQSGLAEGMSMHESPFSSARVVTATSEQLSSQLGDETVVLSLKTGVYYGLNPVGARVWELAQEGDVSLGEIRERILSEFDVTAEVIERDLAELIENLQAEGLIQIAAAE
jgi:hypothetical protein